MLQVGEEHRTVIVSQTTTGQRDIPSVNFHTIIKENNERRVIKVQVHHLKQEDARNLSEAIKKECRRR